MLTSVPLLAKATVVKTLWTIGALTVKVRVPCNLSLDGHISACFISFGTRPVAEGRRGLKNWSRWRTFKSSCFGHPSLHICTPLHFCSSVIASDSPLISVVLLWSTVLLQMPTQSPGRCSQATYHVYKTFSTVILFVHVGSLLYTVPNCIIDRHLYVVAHFSVIIVFNFQKSKCKHIQ